MATTMTYANNSAEQYSAYYEMQLLTRAVANLPYALVAQLGSTINSAIPKNRGDTINWRSLAALSVATTPLSEGQTPEATEATFSSQTDTVDEYGSYIQYTDKFINSAIDPILANYSQILGEQVGATIDQLVRDVAAAQTTNVSYSGGVSARTDLTAAMVLTAKDILKAKRSLEQANARPIQGKRYIGIISPYTAYDMMNDSTLYSIMEQVYPRDSGNPLLTGYFGTFYGIDWYESSNAKTYTSTVTVHATMIFGADAIGIGGMAGMMPGKITASQYEPNTGKRVSPVTLINTPPNTPSKDDPLHQRGTLGWLTTFCCKLLNENFLAKIEHGVTA